MYLLNVFTFKKNGRDDVYKTECLGPTGIWSQTGDRLFITDWSMKCPIISPVTKGYCSPFGDVFMTLPKGARHFYTVAMHKTIDYIKLDPCTLMYVNLIRRAVLVLLTIITNNNKSAVTSHWNYSC
jgi:hypothetical protein